MARLEDWESGGDYWDDSPDAKPQLEQILFGTNGAYMVDELAQDMMWQAVVADNERAYDDFVEYMRNVYDIDVEQEWDWQDFRTWYDNQ